MTRVLAPCGPVRRICQGSSSSSSQDRHMSIFTERSAGLWPAVRTQAHGWFTCVCVCVCVCVCDHTLCCVFFVLSNDLWTDVCARLNGFHAAYTYRMLPFSWQRVFFTCTIAKAQICSHTSKQPCICQLQGSCHVDGPSCSQHGRLGGTN